MKVNKLGAVVAGIAFLIIPGLAPGVGLNPYFTNGPPALDFWAFPTNWVTHYGNVPISATNVVSVSDLVDGNCVLLDSTNAAWLQYSTTQNRSNRLTVATGSVMFWFASSWSGTNAGGSGPGDWGR